MKHRPVSIAGLDVLYWVMVFNGCHAKTMFGSTQWCWPDGKSYLEQENVTIEMFILIQEQLTRMNKK